jgi:hypothetical protein
LRDALFPGAEQSLCQIRPSRSCIDLACLTLRC